MGKYSLKVIMNPSKEWSKESIASGWGEAIIETITEFLEEIEPYNRPAGILELAYDHDGPIAFFPDRPDYRKIGLCTIPYYYSQLVYQLAHEMVHYIAMHNPGANTWFEETLAELSSFYFLKKAANKWAFLNGKKHLQEFAPNHMKYLNENLLSKIMEIRRDEVQKWFENHRNELLRDCYCRNLNSEAADYLLPYFEAHAGIWNILGTIPKDRQPDFSSYLSVWEENSKAQNLDNHIHYFRDSFGV